MSSSLNILPINIIISMIKQKVWEVGTKFSLEILKGKDNSEDLGLGESVILKWILGSKVWECLGFIWLKVRTGNELLWT
jgi:hypothetical protein